MKARVEVSLLRRPLEAGGEVQSERSESLVSERSARRPDLCGLRQGMPSS